MLKEAKAASQAPAEDGSMAEDDDWGSDGDDWKRKKRSVVEESPYERWTRDTHEVKIMEYLTSKMCQLSGTSS